MAQLVDIKSFVSDLIGTGNGSTAVPKRDRIINMARRRFYSESRWSFLKKSATITLTANTADLPTDYNIKFDPFVYKYSSTFKYQFKKVDWDELSKYSTSDYCFAIDRDNRHIKVSSDDATLTMDYYQLPADKAIDTSDNTDVEPVDDITPIGLLATAMWYLSSRQASGKYQMFMDEYKQEVVRLLQSDTQNRGIRKFNTYSYTNEGYKR